MGFVQWDKSEVDIWSGGSVLLLSLSFTDEQQLHFSVSGGTLSFYTFNMTNQVNKSDSWDFYFDGKTMGQTKRLVTGGITKITTSI